MAWLIRLLFFINKDWFMAVIGGMAVIIFLPKQYQNMIVLGGLSAWIMILQVVMVKVMKALKARTAQEETEKDLNGNGDLFEG